MSNSTAAKVGTTSGTSRRSKKSQEEANLKNTSQADGPETQQTSSVTTDKGAQIIAMPQIKLQETPKPETSQLALPPLPGNRPIDEGSLEVVGTISVMGERPIFASHLQVADTIIASGERPIAASSIQLAATEMIMGNRPIASNSLDVNEDLMGYLD